MNRLSAVSFRLVLAFSVASCAAVCAAVCAAACGPSDRLPETGPAAARPALASSPAAGPTQPATPDTLLARYSQLYAERKDLQAAALNPYWQAAPLALRNQRKAAAEALDNRCRQAAAARSDQDVVQADTHVRLQKELARLDARLKTGADSARRNHENRLRTVGQRLQAATAAAAQALQRRRQGFRFEVHGTRYLAYVADLDHEQIQLYLNADSMANTKFTTLERLLAHCRQHGPPPAMLANAGMFHANQAPVGLLVAAGRILNPLNTATPDTDENFYMRPNGVFSVSAQALARIDSTAAYRPPVPGQPPVLAATQSGPLLVINNRLNPHFSAYSSNAKVRSGVGILNKSGNAGRYVVFLTTEGTSTFYDFATTFRELFGCANALFLDGAISKMYLAEVPTAYTGGFFGPLLAVTEGRATAAPGPKAAPAALLVAPSAVKPGALPVSKPSVLPAKPVLAVPSTPAPPVPPMPTTLKSAPATPIPAKKP